MSADHLLHAQFGRWGFHLAFECIGDPAEHFSLWEKTCTCDCDMCTGDDPDHWVCDRQEHEHSFDGRPPCQTECDLNRCWVLEQDCPIEETITGTWPERPAFPVPVHISYEGDGEWHTHYAGPPVAAGSDTETEQ